jgi:hypothetical protein
VTLTTEDRLDILELLARADNAATRRDAHTYVALFAEDGVLDGEKGEYRGRRELFDAVGRVWASEGVSSVHLTLNAVIDALPGETQGAVTSSTLMIADPGPPAAVRSVSAIVQQVLKIGGRWYIARRTVGGA